MPVDAVGLTQDLIRFNTIVPPGAEKACAQHIGRHLEGAGFHCDYVEMGEGRANLIARIGGRTDTLPLAFTGHIDVVPLGTRPWTMDPFAADIGDGKVYADNWLASVFAAVDNVTAGKSAVEAAPYFTDASVLTPAYGGLPTVVLGPGPAHMAHQTDEYCEVVRIEQSKAIYLDLIRAWSGL